MAIGEGGWNDNQSQSVLLEALDDTNQFIGAAAACSLARLDATNIAPVLLAKLKEELQSTNRPTDALEQQATEIIRDFRGEENHAVNVLDPDNMEVRLFVNAEVTANVKRMAAMRLPPRPFNLPTHNYCLSEALIEALGDLQYVPAEDELFKLSGTDYEAAATSALAETCTRPPDR